MFFISQIVELLLQIALDGFEFLTLLELFLSRCLYLLVVFVLISPHLAFRFLQLVDRLPGIIQLKFGSFALFLVVVDFF